jgi:nicotinamide mononucleotide transporter
MSGVFAWANVAAFTVGSQTVKWSDLLGNVCALATVGLAVRRSLLTWPVQIVSCVLLFGANMSAHLGGNAARQVVLGVMAGYGWWRWTRGIRTTREVPVRFANWNERFALVVALGLGTVGFALLLEATNASWAPWPDAYIFIGSVVATLAQARGWVEFWLVWVLVDCVGVPLAWEHGLVVSGAVYGVFLVLCAIGIRDWMQRSRQLPLEAVPA